MKKIFYYLLAVFVATACLFGVAFFFYSDNIIEQVLNKALKLKISSGYVGGDIIEDIFDTDGDDNGDGSLIYPDYEAFKDGSLDLIRYTVHKPVYEAKWQNNPEYWQLDFEFSAGTEELRNILVYIGTDNNTDTSIEPLFENTDGINFAASKPWSYALLINEKESVVYNSQKQIISETENYYRKNGKEVLVRIPLKSKELQKIYSAKKTYHYVFTGAYSKWDKNGFLADNKTKKTVYDLLDIDSSQKSQLALKKFSPVEVDMTKIKSASINQNFVKDVKTKYEEIVKTKTASETNYGSDQLTAAVLEYNKENYDKAEEMFEAILKTDENNAIANAYYGTCIAIKGGSSNPMKAMKLVNNAFTYLDKAVELSKNTPQEVETRINRASVASSVPETVFKKSETGAIDYERIAKLYKANLTDSSYTENEKLTLAYYYVKAAENYSKASKNTEARMCINKAEKLF